MFAVFNRDLAAAAGAGQAEKGLQCATISPTAQGDLGASMEVIVAHWSPFSARPAPAAAARSR